MTVASIETTSLVMIEGVTSRLPEPARIATFAASDSPVRTRVCTPELLAALVQVELSVARPRVVGPALVAVASEVDTVSAEVADAASVEAADTVSVEVVAMAADAINVVAIIVNKELN